MKRRQSQPLPPPEVVGTTFGEFAIGYFVTAIVLVILGIIVP
jgi:hypothetical protein